MCCKPIFRSKVAQKGKTCSRLLELQKNAPNAKSCSNVAEHNRDRSSLYWAGAIWSIWSRFSDFVLSVFCIFLRLHSDVQNLKGNIYIKSSQLKNRMILTALFFHLCTRIKTPLSSVFQKLVGFTLEVQKTQIRDCAIIIRRGGGGWKMGFM